MDPVDPYSDPQHCLKVTEKNSRIRIHSQTQRYGSADPDPYQNFMDLQHCYKGSEPTQERGGATEAVSRRHGGPSVQHVLNRKEKLRGENIYKVLL